MATVRATTFEILPQRIDLVGLVLSSAGLGALLGSGYGRLRETSREKRAALAEVSSLLFAAISAIMFFLLASIQAIT